MRALYEELHTSPEQGKWESDQFVFNRLLAAGRVVPDYHSKFMWTANANLHVLDHIPVPRPIDGLQSGIPYEEDTLPRLGIDKATGQIPIFLHFNMSKKTANSSRFRDKAELMNNSLQRMWWSNGANKAFRAIARQRLHEGKIYIDHAKGKTMLFANLCRDLFGESYISCVLLS